ncbi:MAG: metal ABC transporter permease [Bacillota bacterium]
MEMEPLILASSFLRALIEREFMQLALITGIFIGFLAPLIGAFVVIKRLSLIADTLSHFSLAGLAIGMYFINILSLPIGDPLYIGMVFGIIGALLIEVLRSYYKNYKEISMPIVISIGTALSALFISLSGGFNSSVYNYLFGSILTVGRNFVIIISLVTLLVLALVIIFYKKIVIVSFDEAYARLLGISVRKFQIVTTILLGIIVSLAIETVGVLLVGSLMIIPVATAMKVGRSFKSTLALAIIFSETAVILGLWFSYIFSIPSGATIVLFNITILVVVIIVKKFVLSRSLKEKQS